jgi:hypothetical protein
MDDEGRTLLKNTLDRILQSGIKPHVNEIARIAAGRGIAVVLFNACDAAIEVLQHSGWKGEMCFRMTTKFRKAFAKNLADIGDTAAARWLLRKPNKQEARVFLFVDSATLCLNCGPDGWYPEPGTIDAERTAMFH